MMGRASVILGLWTSLCLPSSQHQLCLLPLGLSQQHTVTPLTSLNLVLTLPPLPPSLFLRGVLLLSVTVPALLSSFSGDTLKP